ncbi:MAG: acyl-ACP--UDP-N-acetylglucosamine O-acyltransferase [Candidatus Omnitrophica bacterium]|nr:acyl-ACP--UDP-N-acetylglucosamine O-acyltransferase [Candidatus Omnitrophota bacterium]MCF7876988.1 acyl-ACP--UDP-N-acetylglucosamine O-acyltransferase [Candidatus Omnitrophota bacterium]MCF7878508.1 acyl-ACP--UDP-N-acetylglucosamine O-acyltransferase [Candidatus Omnitrophota bacterium]MCF7893161.1 acyl-ACP--UDP-N-acetylglucosamine O-acyltransferase [Candidatus Omnitrophota bacterium]
MGQKIDSRAMIGSSAKIADNVKIGPYAIIADNAEIGEGTVIEPFAQVLGHTKVGCNCHIFSQAVVGSIPQDLKYKGEKSYLVIGDRNRIREFVTINPGTEKEAKTIIGNDNLIMAYSHIAHDCVIGDENVFANGSTLAGYVDVGRNAVVGGLVAIHQFCRLGDYSIVGGCSKVVQDIPPYSMCDGHPAVVRALNSVGLKRKKFPNQAIKDLKKAFKIIFFDNHSFAEAIKIVETTVNSAGQVKTLLNFVAASKRGIGKK